MMRRCRSSSTAALASPRSSCSSTSSSSSRSHSSRTCSWAERRRGGRGHVVVMLAVIWWMYDGYAWLTNAIATDLLRFRLLLLGGMGAFLVVSLADPDRVRWERARVRSRVPGGRTVARRDVCEGHIRLGGGCDSPHRPVQPLGGGARARRRDRRWAHAGDPLAAAALLLWVTPWFTSTEGFVIAAEHFVERHGLVVIIALGEGATGS